MFRKTLAALLLLSTGLCAAADALCLQLFRSLAQESTGNMVYSPVGVENVLRSLGRYSAGRTLAELNALPMGKASAHSPHMVQADGLFVAETLPRVPGMKGVERVDFSQSTNAARTINNWCREHTRGLISQLVQPRDFNRITVFVATNAVYLKEQWLYPFTPENSFTGDFRTPNGKTVPARMMSRTAHFPAAKGEDWVAVALPYASATESPCYFIAISPTSDIRGFVAGLTEKKYRSILSRLGRGQTRVIIPAFTMDGSALCLNEALKAAGLKHIFTHADFSRLTTTKADIFLSKVLQKCYVKVDEQGTEAAAATAAIANLRALPRTVALDRPFIWIIGDLSGNTTPLFMGIVEQP